MAEANKRSSNAKQEGSSILASTNSEPGKKDGTDLLLLGAEIAAAGLLIRFGLKQLAKNGISVVGETEKLAKGVGLKFNAKAASYTPYRVVDQPAKNTGVTSAYSLPPIRTSEREIRHISR